MSNASESGVEAAETPAARLSVIAGDLFRGGPLLLRTLQRYRPFICPFEDLVSAVPRGATILDIGCGGGLFLGLLAAEGRISSGLGFDSSRPAIAVAQQMARLLADKRGEATLEFRCLSVQDPMPEGSFDVVSIIDVMHHVPLAARKTVFQEAVSRLKPNGILLYKDVVEVPLWRSWANKLHDLILARQWIHNIPVADVEKWAKELHLTTLDSRTINRYWYGHELRVFARTG